MSKNNAFSQIRTDDLLITSEVPYQLGHKGNEFQATPVRIELTISRLTVLRLNQLGHGVCLLEKKNLQIS